MILLFKWQQLWQSLGAKPDKISENLYHEIIASYSEDHRHYHTLQHLAECLEKFEALKFMAEHPAEIELALWFHDAVYEPNRQDNEQLSAEWVQSSILKAGLAESLAMRVYDLIMATRHHASSGKVDEKILIDCDLAILGALPERFHEYERQIRAEYAFVPEALYKAKRKEVLAGFLARDRLFNTLPFIEQYDVQARTNLSQTLAHL